MCTNFPPACSTFSRWSKAARRVALILLCVASGAAPAPRADAGSRALLKQAAENIQRYRQGRVTLRLIDQNGAPIADAALEIEQQTHWFSFGGAIRPQRYHDARYLKWFGSLFSMAQLLEFNWGQYEPDYGKPLVESRLQFIRRWCLPHGVERFYGHMLVWTRQYGEYPKTALPLWLFRHDRARQYELLRARIQREVRAFKDVDIVWDLVNEPVHCRRWGDWDKPNNFDEPLEQVIPYVADALRWAHAANPEARLLINEYAIFASSHYRDRFRRLVEALLAQGVPLHAVGIQAHDLKARYWPAPQEVWAACELFGTKLGLDVYFTELCYRADPESQVRGRYQSGFWTPQRQAEAIEEFYRVAFGHPRVEGIVYFSLVDGDNWLPSIGLLDEQYNPRPAWHRLQRLIRHTWWTRLSGRSDSAGSFSFRGFYGRYRVRATIDGKAHVWRRTLRPGGPTVWELRIGGGHP